MFARIVGESFARNPRRKLLTAAALVLGMAAATATLTVALDVGDRLAHEFRSLGANLLVMSQSDTLPLEIGGVDYRPVDEGAYLPEGDLGNLKTIFWRNNIIGFAPVLELPAEVQVGGHGPGWAHATVVGTWHAHSVTIPGEANFTTGIGRTHPWWQVEGAWFADEGDECLIGRQLAARLSVVRGDVLALRADGRTGLVKVTGLLTTGGPEEEAVVVSLHVAQKLANRPGEYRRLFVSALVKPDDELGWRHPEAMTPAEFDRWYCSPYISSIGHQIQEILPGTDVRPIRRVAESEGRILARVSGLFWLVTIAALVAVALAVGATAATTVLERRLEVGLMKALGATRGLVAGFFVVEQLLVALLGGVLGYGLGVVLARSLGESIFGIPVAVRMILLPVVLGLAAVVVLVGSLVPLWRGARFSPAPILRGE
jgi:putative ABC transport system permease protein